MTFGERLRQLREENGLGLRELSRLTGLSLSHLQYLEKDDKRPGDETLGRLARELGVSKHQLIAERDESRVATQLTVLLREEAGSLSEEERLQLLDIARQVLESDRERT